MPLFKTLTESIFNSSSNIITEASEQKLLQAAQLFMNTFAKQRGKKYLKAIHTEEYKSTLNATGCGIRYYSADAKECIRINTSNSFPGVIYSIDVWLSPKEVADYNITSENFSLASMAKQIAQLLDERDLYKFMESSVNESVNKIPANILAEINSKLAQGVSVAELSREYSAYVSYSQIAKIKRGVPDVIKAQPSIKKNEETLEDKLKYFDSVMEDIAMIVAAMAKGKARSLLIAGRAGTGKTFTVENTLNNQGMVEDIDYFVMKGSTSVLEVFKKLYQFNGKILVFDDADTIFETPEGRNILKAALDTKPVRRISYMKNIKFLYDPKEVENNPELEMDYIDQGLVPKYFDFTGRIIFISNMKQDKIDPDGALRSRSMVVNLDPDDETLIAKMEKLLPYLEPKSLTTDEKREVFEFVKTANNISMRTFVKACEMYEMDLDKSGRWKQLTRWI
jgi:hypothetical protein